MKKTLKGLLIGTVAGALDLGPMVAQKLPLEADLSAFSMWVVIGILLVSVDWKFNQIIKGIIVAFLVLLPNAFIIGWKEPVSLIPIGIMTLLLGAGSGFAAGRISNKT